MRALAPCALLAALLAGGSLVLGEDQPADDHDSIRPIGGLAFVDELEVTVVNIVAYVTDKQGTAVTNLTRDDFRILHDGEERPISNFQLYTEELIRSYYQAEEGPPLPPAADPGTELEAPPLTEIQPVWMMILVDNDNLQPLDRNRVLGQLRTFVRENTKPPVKMMVASTNRALKVEQEFTDDSTEILGALEGVKMTTGGRTSRDTARSEVYDEIDRYTQSQSSSGQSSLSQARSLAVSFAEEELNGLQFTFGVIREAVNLLARPFVGDEPFIVAYPDDIHVGEVPLARQLIRAWERTGCSVLATLHDPPDLNRYGVISITQGIPLLLCPAKRTFVGSA